MFYNLENEVADAYRDVIEAFERLSGCSRTWHIPSAGAVRDQINWKRNAGAKYLLERKSISIASKLPPIIRSNIDVPCIPVGTQTLYFFPDKLMIFDGEKVGAIGYDHLRIQVENSNFIEEETVPKDSHILSYTWKHPNKNGGPDRRFKDNRKIPVCAYESIHFASNSGLNEVIQVSKRGYGTPFSIAIQRLSEFGTSVEQKNRGISVVSDDQVSLLTSP